MSMSPMNGRPGTNGWTGCVVFASTACSMRVRLQPPRSVASTCDEKARRYSAVRNWFVDSKVRGNCGKSVGSSCTARSCV